MAPVSKAGVTDEKKKDEKDGDEKPVVTKDAVPKDPRTVLIENVGQCLKTINSAVIAGDARIMGRASRAISTLRRTMTAEVLVAFLEEFASSPNKARYIGWAPAAVPSAQDVEMKEASVAPIDACAEEMKTPAPIEFPVFAKPYPVEFEVFGALLVLVCLLDRKDDVTALELAGLLIPWLKTFNRRTLDTFNARAYFYLALVYERQGKLTELRSEFLAGYRTACLRHESMSQATLLNSLLRSYLSCNLYEQALKLVQKTTFPESQPNAQYARYLFYIGRIKAVQLEYSDAHKKLMHAIRKAPQSPNVAIGFKVSATKFVIIVELLMGGIPERSMFTQEELRVALLPYYEITQAVRSGKVDSFQGTMKRHETLFKNDKTLTLINRLRYNVIKTGLRSINTSYSRISLKDICEKLGLETPQDAAGVCAKACVDGVISGTIDYEQQFLQSEARYDLYSSNEPQTVLHQRILFFLQMHNDAVKALSYPEEEAKETDDPEERREREKRQMAEADDDDDDDMGLL